MLYNKSPFRVSALRNSSPIFAYTSTFVTIPVRRMSNSGSSEFPPKAIREIVTEVTTLLKERNETVSVAETVYMITSDL